jgi:hypothetical protein
MSGTPVKRQRRAERERAASGRAQASDPATRVWAVQRAAEIGDERAAAEVGVSRATLRSWRRRLKAEGASVSAGSSGAAVSVPAVSPVAADGDELGMVEAELVEVRAARAAALERSIALARAGNDLSAQHAARAARDFAVAARSLAGEVVLLREADVRIGAAGNELLEAVLREFFEAAGVPLSLAVRRLLGGVLRAHGDDSPGGVDFAELGERARVELAQHFARQVPASDAPVGEDRGDGDAPEREPVGRVASCAAKVTASDDGDRQADAEPLELVPMSAVPADFRSRFALGDDGAERARRAYSERLRDQQRRRDAEKAAEATTASERPRVPADRIASEWDRPPRRRGRGPSGERAGP